MPDFNEEARLAAAEIVRIALAEDLGARGDVTSSAMIPAGLMATGAYIFKQDAVLAGTPVVEEVCRQVSSNLRLNAVKADGGTVEAGEAPLEIRGPARDVLAAERTTINFLSHLCGVATLTRRFVEAVEGTQARILDTRKTTPGLRALEKYAVRCGSGFNHRMGLFDQMLVKDNHLALMFRGGRSGELADAVADARRLAPPEIEIEVEAKTIEEVEAALESDADIIMLDNMPLETIAEAVALIRARGAAAPLVEVSGGVTLENVTAIAATGVDQISVGALTHSAPAIDMSLEIK